MRSHKIVLKLIGQADAAIRVVLISEEALMDASVDVASVHHVVPDGGSGD
jgi:hypothetical protein